MLSPGAHAELITDLKGLGPEGVKAMIDLLKSGDEKERFLAANLLEQLNAPAAIPALREAALNDPDKMAGVMAGHALALMDDAGTVPALREIADANKTWESRVNALWGLCKHGDERALAESLAMLKDDKVSDDHKAALGANLMLLTDPELMPIIDETLRRFAGNEQVAALAVNYYDSVATPEARARLEAMANDAKLAEAVRKQAREALAKSKGGAR
jgi:HEAT repeat protein